MPGLAEPVESWSCALKFGAGSAPSARGKATFAIIREGWMSITRRKSPTVPTRPPDRSAISTCAA